MFLVQIGQVVKRKEKSTTYLLSLIHILIEILGVLPEGFSLFRSVQVIDAADDTDAMTADSGVGPVSYTHLEGNIRLELIYSPTGQLTVTAFYIQNGDKQETTKSFDELPADVYKRQTSERPFCVPSISVRNYTRK